MNYISSQKKKNNSSYQQQEIERQKAKKQKMSRLIVQGLSIPTIIMNHLTELLAISNAVLELCIKCEKVKQHLTQKIVTSIRLSISSDKDDKQFNIIEQLINRVQSTKVDYLYYERIIYHERYEELVKNLLDLLKEICKNSKHEFYSSRKLQIEVIGLIVTAFDEIQRRVKKYLFELSIQYPHQLSNYVESTLKLVKKIKVEKCVKRDNGLKVIFNFETQSNKDEKKSEKIKDSDTEAFKFSHVFTAATTRPSSTVKSNTEGSKILKISQNIYPPFAYELEPKKEDRNSHIVERIAQSKITFTERCKTAKIRRINRAQQKQINQQHLNNVKSSLDVLEQFKENHGRISYNVNSKKENKSHNSKEIESLANSQGQFSSSKNNFFQEPVRHKNKKKSRVARIINPNSLWGITSPKKKSQENGTTTSKPSSKHRKGKKNSEDIMQNQSGFLKQFTKRNYQSDQQRHLQDEKTGFQLSKSNSYKKKTHKSKRHKVIKGVIDPLQIPEKETYEQKAPVILLIKPPEQATKQDRVSARSSVKQAQDPNVQKFIKREAIMMPRKPKAKKKVDINDSRSVSIENVQNHEFRVELQQINKIRSEFLQARWRNKIIGLQNQQNSVFFIEQGFLSHRQNMRFQAHLLKMKQNYGKQYHNEPFNIDYEIQEINNQKLKELQRQYTFQVENDWIKQKYHIPENIEGFDQLGLQKVKQFVI